MAVYKRGKSGVYYMDFTLFGQRVYKSTGRYNKVEAKEVEVEARKRIRQEKLLPESQKIKPLLLSQAINKAYDEKWKYNKDGDRTKTRAMRVISFLGDKPITEMNNDDMVALKKALEAEGLKYSTINRYFSHLKTVFNLAQKKWKAINVIPYIQMKKETQGRMRIISREEEQKAIRKAIEKGFIELADIIQVLPDTGLRLSELLNLENQDVNFETNLITIWKNKEGDKPKSIPMTSRVRKILNQRKNRKKLFSITKNQVEKQWQKIRTDLKLSHDREFVLHSFRHTFASRLVEKDIDLYRVKELCGHSTIQVTEKYAHLKPEKLKEAIGVLEILGI